MSNEIQGLNIEAANLQAVDLSQARAPTTERLRLARNWVLAKYSQELIRAMNLPRDHNDRLAKKDLSGYALQNINLHGANLQGFILRGANLQDTNLRDAKGLTKKRLQQAKNWILAYYSRGALDALALPHNHNERICSKDLSGYSLQGVNLKGAELADFNLKGANLQEANLCETAGLTRDQLQQAKNWVLAYYSRDMLDLLGLPYDHNERVRKRDFTDALWLRAANLQGADLKDAKLESADFRGADLQDANLTNASGLLIKNMAGANLSNAKLPKSISDFEGLAHIEEVTKSARKVFTLMLLGCAYGLLTILTTSDPQLLTNSPSYPLPLFRNKVPIVGLYKILPIALLGPYIYFLLYVHRLWDTLSDLPSFLPDGRSIDNAASSWLVIGLARQHLLRLRDTSAPFSWLQARLSTLLDMVGCAANAIRFLAARFVPTRFVPYGITFAIGRIVDMRRALLPSCCYQYSPLRSFERYLANIAVRPPSTITLRRCLFLGHVWHTRS